MCTGGSCVGGKIKLNGMDIGGQLLLGATAQGSEVLNGGQITGIFYPCEDIGNFAGEATFTGVAAGGQIYAFDVNPPFKADVSGDITINGDYVGLFKVDGDFTSTASLTITGDLKANAGDDGLIWIVEEAAGDVTIKKDLIGHVHYPKTFATNGSVTVEGNVTSSGLFKTGDLATGETHDGDLIFQGNVVGDILIHGNMSGDVTITDDQSGDLAIDEGLSGSITVGGALANAGLGGGRIMIAGESSGPIKVGKKTGSLTLIQVAGGLAAGATIEINTTQGPFNAVGDMHIGGTTPAALPFDGCIRIYGQSLTGNHGHLKGDLDIVMCHPNGHQLLICIDGDDAGNVTLDQTGCIPANANWDCYSPGCP
ncbi:MAG: hypothetical protein O7D91_07485 [Planctomycetota bacterium]|nr:hypothetical protein [Planctomycetota bacterium]